MNIAQARPRIWTPQVIVLSIIVHALVLYYAIVAFNIVPPPIELKDPPTIDVFRLPPPTPKPIEPEPIKKRPLFQQRPTPTPPVQPLVDPSPLPPTISPVTTGPASIDVREPILEQPMSQLLPRYPKPAEIKQIEGRVRMSITIMPDGSVRDVQILSARPAGYFEVEAIRAVQQWRYKPSNVIRTNVVVDIDFVLN